MNFYNEIDPFAAQWLRNLIDAGHLPAGVVDQRSIEDIAPHELAPYTQCHFFAGIGGWPLALRMAGWPDDRPAWTGSCPCQPFSSAGKGAAFDDERHLWPAWQWLIAQCRPAVILGEQVASPAARQWLDLVCADLEASGYTCGAANLCAAGAGAPHIRQRLYWVADAGMQQPQQHERSGARPDEAEGRRASGEPARCGDIGRLADDARLEGRTRAGCTDQRAAGPRGLAGRLGDATDGRHQPGQGITGIQAGQGVDLAVPLGGIAGRIDAWSDIEWIACSDGKARPAEPGISPLAHGTAGRVGKLRAYGNAIVAPLAAQFVRAVMA